MKPKFGRLGLLASSFLTLALNGTSRGADGTFTADVSANWSAPANWAGGTVADGSGFTASFTSNVTADRTITLDSARTIGKLVFSDATPATAGSWIISGANILTLDGGTPTVTVDALGTAKNATISSVVAGTLGVTKAGAGTLVLSGANTFTGQTNISTGILQAGNAAALGAAGAGNETIVQNGATFNLNGQAITPTEIIRIVGTGAGGIGALVNNGGAQNNALNSFVLTGNATIGGTGRFDIRTGTTPTLDLAGFKLTKLGANQFSLVGANVTNGDIEINAGTVSVETTTSLIGTGTVTVNPGGTLAFYQTTAANITRPIVSGGGAISNAGINAGANSPIALTNATTTTFGSAFGVTTTFNGAISGGGNFAKTGADTIVLAGSNSYSGTTSVAGGTLQLDYTTNDNNKLSDTGSLTLGGTTLSLTGGTHLDVVASTSISGANTITRAAGSTAKLGLGAITRAPGATLNISAGAVATTSNVPVSGNLGPWLTVGGASLASTDGSNNIVPVTYTDVATGSGVITDGMDQVRVSSATAGAVTLAAGPTINVNTISRNEAGLGTVDIAAGKILRIGANGGVFSGTGSGGITFGTAANVGVLTAGGTDNTAGTLYFNLIAGAVTVNSTITDNGTGVVGVAKNGGAELILAGANTYSGGTTFNGGSIRASLSDTAFGTGPLTFAANSTLASQIGGGARVLANNVVINTGVTGSIDSGYFPLTLNGVISGAGNLSTASVGTTTLTGVNTYTGTTNVGAGASIVIGGSGSLGAGTYAPAVTVAGTLNLATSANQVFSAAVSGAGTLAKTGTGSLTLSAGGANSLPTTITLSQGTTTIGGGSFGGDKMVGTGILTVNTGAILILNAPHALGGDNVNMTDSIVVSGGTLTLSSEQYVKNLTLAGGTINGAADLRMSGASNVLVNGTAVSTISSLVNLVNAGNFNVEDTTASPAADLVISGAVTNTGAVVKTGVGTLSLTGVSTYNSTTTVNAGTLAVNNTTGSGLGTSVTTVATGGTLAGTGSFTGAATISVGGTIAPGNAGIGTLSTGNLTVPGTFACDVTGITADKIAVTGDLNVSGTLALTASSPSGTLVLASYTGNLTGTFATVTGLPSGFAVNYNTAAKQIELIPAVSPVYAAWATAKGLTAAVNDGVTQDPDLDGRTNLSEYAFAGNPLSPMSDGNIVSKLVTLNGQQVLTLTLPIRTTATFAGGTGEEASTGSLEGVFYRIQGSTDLTNWTQNVNQITDPTELATVQGTIATTKPLETGWTYRSFYVVNSNPTQNAKMFIRGKAE